MIFVGTSLSALVQSLAFATDLPDTSVIVDQLGKFHFLVLHFPVVLVTFLPLVALAALFPFGAMWRKTLPYFIHLSTLSAIGTSVFGFFEISHREEVKGQLALHQYGGYAVTAYLVLFSLIVLVKRVNFNREPSKILVAAAFVAAALITAAAHLGGESVHGSLFVLFGG